VVAVKVAQQVSPDKVLYYAQLLGISTMVSSGNTNDRNLAMALGGLTRGVIPLEIVSAYGVLANQGVRVEPVSIIKVIDRNGKILEQNQPREKAVINERSAYVLTDMMRGVLTQGTGAGANIGRPAAGKTGTTNDYKDAWFVGFTPDLAAGVWMGFDNVGNLDGVTGGTIPATIWRDFMTSALANVPARDFPRPSGIVSAAISPKDGLLVPDPKSKDAQNEIFIEGTQPTKPSTGGVSNRTDQPGDSQSGDKTLPPAPPRLDKNTAPAPTSPTKPDLTKKN